MSCCPENAVNTGLGSKVRSEFRTSAQHAVNPGTDVRTGGERGSLQSAHVEIGSVSGIRGISGLKKNVQLAYDKALSYITHP